MAHSGTAPLYQKITDDIFRRLQGGEFSPGDRMYSIEECRQHYSVSATTAIRAIDELKQLGVLESIKGKGSFFKGIPRANAGVPKATTLRSLAVLSHKQGFFTNGFQAEICTGIEEAAQAAGLSMRLQHIPFHNPTGVHAVPFELAEDEGVILIGPSPNLATLSLFSDWWSRSVLIDGVYPNATSIATDNLVGMVRLVDELVKLGHTHLLLGITFPRSPNCVNDNERRQAFDFAVEQHGVRGEVMSAADLPAMLAKAQDRQGPTAVMFAQDNGAQAFCELAIEAGLHIPRDVSVTGFDGYMLDLDQYAALTTMAVDRRGLGRAAVESLLGQNPHDHNVAVWTRVKPIYRPGTTIAPPSH